MKKVVKCDWCGKEIERYPSRIKPHNFCSRRCQAKFTSRQDNPNHYKDLKSYTNISKHMHNLNLELNSTRMNLETRKKLRQSHLGTGEQKGYAKYFGKAEHRLIVEQILSRPLLNTEVVHHIDGNKRNNAPKNLMVLTQAEHARLHIIQRRDVQKEDDAHEVPA